MVNIISTDLANETEAEMHIEMAPNDGTKSCR